MAWANYFKSFHDNYRSNDIKDTFNYVFLDEFDSIDEFDFLINKYSKQMHANQNAVGNTDSSCFPNLSHRFSKFF